MSRNVSPIWWMLSAHGSPWPLLPSVGEQPTASYALWKEAGASRFLLKYGNGGCIPVRCPVSRIHARATGGCAAAPAAGRLRNLRVMAVLRIALPWSNLPATTALASLDPVSGQREGLLAGGNVLMPGFTPAAHREDYCIYDNKHRVSMDEARQVIESAGRTHSLHRRG